MTMEILTQLWYINLSHFKTLLTKLTDLSTSSSSWTNSPTHNSWNCVLPTYNGTKAQPSKKFNITIFFHVIPSTKTFLFLSMWKTLSPTQERKQEGATIHHVNCLTSLTVIWLLIFIMDWNLSELASIYILVNMKFKDFLARIQNEHLVGLSV